MSDETDETQRKGQFRTPLDHKVAVVWAQLRRSDPELADQVYEIADDIDKLVPPHTRGGLSALSYILEVGMSAQRDRIMGESGWPFRDVTGEKASRRRAANARLLVRACNARRAGLGR